MGLAQNLAACQRHLQATVRRFIRGAIWVAGLAGPLFILQTASATDLDTIAQRVTDQLLSSVPSASTVQGYMNSLSASGSWSDINYANTAQTNWTPLTHLQRMLAMSQAYSSSTSSLYHNATLGTDLSNAFNFWVSANPMSTNWFDNDIAAPQALGKSMVLISPILSPTQITNGQNILGRAKADIPHETGQNVVDEAIAGIYSAVVSRSSADMTSAFASIGGTITVISSPNTGNGIQADHSYQFHGPQLYMGGYGSSYINDTLIWAAVGAGTQYAITPTQQHLLVDYLLDGTQWFIRGRTMDLTANGRQVTFSSYVGAGSGFSSAINYALALGNYRTTELQSFLARQQATISSGAASTTQNILSGNRYYFDSEAMIQQRAGYYASVKVTSSQISQPETGNNQGLKNLYLGDGVNQIMVTGNEYLGIQPSWNWRRLPGTTVEQDSRSLTPSGTFGATKGTTAFAGGVSDGTFGVTAFNYNRFNVAAKKSWFFFGNEEVALGSAINAPSAGSEVDTTLNQSLLTTNVSYETTASSSVQTLSTGTVTPSNLKWVNQGNIGYFFLTPVSNATIQAIAQSGKWSDLNTAESSSTVTQNVFTLYLNHGTAVDNGSYSYIVVPNLIASQMDSYWASMRIQVIQNDSTAQAVRHSGLDLTEATFYSPGFVTFDSGQTVGVNAASTIMLQRPQVNVLKLSASNPNAVSPALALQVQLTGVKLSGPTSTWFDALGTATATFNLPGGVMGGSTCGMTLSSDGALKPTVTLVSNDQATSSTYNVTGNVALANDTTFNNDQYATLSFSGIVSGSSAITKTGAGTLKLTGANTYTGDTAVQAGTLSITNPTLSLADGADVLLTTGTFFNLNFSATDTIRSLFFDGVSQAVGTWGSLASTATNKSNFFTGTGVLNVTTFVSPVLSGDYNNDGKVDAADYIVWRKNPGGVYTADDYNTWRANFGQSFSFSSGSGASANATVPEPLSVILFFAAAGPCALRRWRTRKFDQIPCGDLVGNRLLSRLSPGVLR
jgi:chondroitin AC lyase